MNKKEWNLVGHCPVDSGQLMITDPCYLDSHWEKEEFDGESSDYFNYSYLGCCNQTLKGDGGEIFGLNREGNFGLNKEGKLSDISLGVVSRTGWGDGHYPVYAKVDEETGRVRELKIIFMEEE